MKAVRVHGPCDARLEDIPVREPEENEVLVKVKSIGLCGTDYDIYTNDLIYLREGISKLPIVPGHEWSGVIEKAGSCVTKFKPGDKVVGECTIGCQSCKYCFSGNYNVCRNREETGIIQKDGAFAEYIVFKEDFLHKFSKMSFDEAALVEPTAVALYSIMRGDVRPNDNVLVIGPGAIGLLASQIAKNVYGARKVILSGTRAERLDRAKTYGLDGVINVREEDLKKRVAEITDGNMIDVVIETSGSIDIFDNIKGIINPNGRIVAAGFFSQNIQMDLDFFITKNVTITGSIGSPGIWDTVIELIEDRKIDVNSIVSHAMRLENFDKGMDIMVNRKENVCKIIFNP